MDYAVFTGDPHYHLVASAAGSKTMCDLSTKGSIKNMREPRFPARLTPEKPPLSFLYRHCPLCIAAQAKLNG
jgi:hypothetical protein